MLRYGLIVLHFQNRYGKEWTEIKSIHDVSDSFDGQNLELNLIESQVCLDNDNAQEIKARWDKRIGGNG
jgi:hypothetical protein